MGVTLSRLSLILVVRASEHARLIRVLLHALVKWNVPEAGLKLRSLIEEACIFVISDLLFYISSLFNFLDVEVFIASRQVLIESFNSGEKFLNLLFTFRNDSVSDIGIDVYRDTSNELLIFSVTLLCSLAYLKAIELSLVLLLKSFVVQMITTIFMVNLVNFLYEDLSDFFRMIMVDSLFKVSILPFNSG